MATKRCVFPILVFLVCAVPAAGQTTVGAEKAANIRRLMTLVGVDKLQEDLAGQLFAALKPIVSPPQSDERARKVLARFGDLLAEEFKQLEFTKITAELYDKYFTNDEIKGLIQFYETPLGQKTIQVLPALMQESMNRGMEQGRLGAARAMMRLAEEFPELKGVLPPKL